LYCGEITFIDKWFGKMMDKLQETGLLDNTMVIVTSDHGFLFGEHDWIGKHSKTLYNHIAHTPLIVSHPEARAKRVQDLVQMADLYPTILQAMDVPVPDDIEAVSILPELLDRGVRPQPLREALIFGVFGGSVYVTDGQWMYVRRPQKSGPLYWYTRSHFQSWQFGQKLDLADTRARAELWDNGRIPVRVKQEWLNAANPGACPIDLEQCEVADGEDADFQLVADELYDMASDYEQQHNAIDRYPEVAERMRSCLREKLDELHAPEEQYVRLGL
jgi:hypothetical protein